ncbi:class II fumarate hydratase [Aciduricibacillus chroicocephali]|uniref:Fumarate hydratase class II n=1 Tax=Aciduricibacillus chroicocephali TaxID=3054939 RepID=A0ABY9KXL1_9BACI|nr:class II fumarate hydratase [Bacillaceae bacterium 44XB]
MEWRIEKDTLGEVKVPQEKLWGAQTQRSKDNFPIGTEKMPQEIIRAFAILKKSCAKANAELGKLEDEKRDAIVYAADSVINGELDDHFPLVVWQTGSGTQSNMNINEVIARKGNEWLEQQGSELRLHPNDDVNKSQSSNDTYPTAMHIAFVLHLKEKVLPATEILHETIAAKVSKFEGIVKIGRTHLQDATPITLGQEMSGWQAMLEKCKSMISSATEELYELAIGGTAVGTGLNAHPDFAEKVCREIADATKLPFKSAKNKFHSLTSYDEAVYAHGALKALAADLMKIANDVRWLASGPRSGLGEILIPTNEPGSSIMPGKVNPTQCEALTMVSVQVMGNDTAIGLAASQGNFELNVYKPVIAYNFLQSCRLLADGMLSFEERCVRGIEPNEKQIKDHLEGSLMLVTALNPHIGYEKAAAIAKKAYADETTLKEAAASLGILDEAEFDRLVRPEEMVSPKA